MPVAATPTASRPRVPLFVSYAHRNGRLARDLVGRLGVQLAPSRTHDYHLWRDGETILIGEDWDARIREALEKCRAGLILLSPALLASSYIAQVELPALMDRLLPVSLAPTNLARHDHRGLEAHQIFNWQTPGGAHRAYSQCTGEREREAFVEALFLQIERRIDAMEARR